MALLQSVKKSGIPREFQFKLRNPGVRTWSSEASLSLRSSFSTFVSEDLICVYALSMALMPST